LIWSFPQRVPPSIVQVGLVSSYDLMPTLCDFLLVDQPDGEFPGRSYAPMATGKPFPKKQPWRTTVFAHYKNTEMARVDRYKVVVRDEGKGPGELYDLRVDRDEAQNQYENPQFEDIRNNLSGQLANWRKSLV
jgi:arylsulfatase A-like enzyme